MRRLVATYRYSDGNVLHIFVDQRKVFIRDGQGMLPKSPITGARTPHPGEGSECVDWDYETLGLYYDYAMADTGWDGDC